MSRPTIDRTLMDIAFVWSKRGTCSRLQVGAVLARDGRAVQSGYNGAPAGQPHCIHDGTEDQCFNVIHAERNVIGYAAREGVPTKGTDLYITHEPCLDCATVLIAAGIEDVHFQVPYPKRTGVNMLRANGIGVWRMA